MSILLWLAIGFTGLLITYFLLILVFSRYVNSPSKNNATAINKGKSNQYYIKEGKVVYVLSGNFFNIGAKEIDGAHRDTFEVLDQDFAKDKHTVYYNDRPVIGADPDTAQSIPNTYSHPSYKSSKRDSSGFLKDAKHVYCGSQLVTGADPITFTALWGVYGMDKDFIYYYNDYKIPRTDTPSYIDNSNTEVLRMADKILYSGQVISDQGPDFMSIDADYSKDKSHVYRYGKIQDGVDAESFKILSPYFRVDKNTAYYFDTPIIGSDAATFQVLNESFSKDNQHVYFEDRKVIDVNPKDINTSRAKELNKRWLWRPLRITKTTVRLVPNNNVSDITNYFHSYKNEVYTYDKKMDGIKASDVIILDEEEKYFTRVKDQFFYYGNPIPNVEPGTFIVISEHFSKDVNQVYWCQYPLINIKPSLFEYTEGLGAEQNEQGDYQLTTFSTDF
ncbi:DKNYY domain-containing protein [Olleya sp. HaHaR_3_96]|uniref:DKNYY domain-containing protein n=1 Tax=Olleya sp. HaHaR_3_96 TaxID=2745560 RepID=UPI001C4F8C0C|nr:DKNYY domain-containing protein [Olleya sp. HaHaR_3_96]QXP59486.1 DKNYY domain-containing protein [Olleya sp. HaHaR_3_96]